MRRRPRLRRTLVLAMFGLAGCASGTATSSEGTAGPSATDLRATTLPNSATQPGTSEPPVSIGPADLRGTRDESSWHVTSSSNPIASNQTCITGGWDDDPLSDTLGLCSATLPATLRVREHSSALSPDQRWELHWGTVGPSTESLEVAGVQAQLSNHIFALVLPAGTPLTSNTITIDGVTQKCEPTPDMTALPSSTEAGAPDLPDLPFLC